MNDQIKELESLALAARLKKGRMDSPSRSRASDLVASIWANPSIDPSPTLQFLEDLKAEALADALRGCWARMDVSRRTLFRKWTPAPSTERSYRRLAFLVASIIDIDGATALDWLGLLIPGGRKRLGKESREMMATILFGERVLSFHTLADQKHDSIELLRIYAALFDIAADPSLSVSPMTRSRLASAILGYLGRTDSLKDSLAVSELRSEIIADAKRWPPALREQVLPAAEINQDALVTSPVAPTVDVAPEGQSTKSETKAQMNVLTPTPVVIGSLQEELPRLENELSNRISALTLEVDLLRRTHECIAKLVESAVRVEAQCESANRELQRLQESLRVIESERDTARADSARASQRAIDFAAALERMRLEAENERKRLSQQISANASGRIAEFKNRVGLNLSRLVVDLPGKETPVTPELGKVLLLQFHQFLDALRQEGIETLPARIAS